MAKPVRIAFDQKVIELPVAAILPTRTLPPSVKTTVKYQRIAKSVAEVGVIEPLSVFPQPGSKSYILLDGHLRLEAQVEQGLELVRCIVEHDDEAFTHNKRVNRLATIQEHFMIVRAIERGVSEEKLARALNVDIQLIKRRRTLLDGICPEVVDMLKDRSVNPTTFEVFRKMKPLRQIEAASLMINTSNFTTNYAKALLAGTKQEELTHPEKPKRIAGMTLEQMARMEREMAAVTHAFKEVEASYGDDALRLVVATRYLDRLIGNERVASYLERHHPEILTEFRSIIAAASLDQVDATLSDT